MDYLRAFYKIQADEREAELEAAKTGGKRKKIVGEGMAGLKQLFGG